MVHNLQRKVRSEHSPCFGNCSHLNRAAEMPGTFCWWSLWGPLCPPLRCLSCAGEKALHAMRQSWVSHTSRSSSCPLVSEDSEDYPTAHFLPDGYSGDPATSWRSAETSSCCFMQTQTHSLLQARESWSNDRIFRVTHKPLITSEVIQLLQSFI